MTLNQHSQTLREQGTMVRIVDDEPAIGDESCETVNTPGLEGSAVENALANIDSVSKRRWERQDYELEIEVHHLGETIAKGHTIDVSLAGMYLEITEACDILRIGETIQVFIAQSSAVYAGTIVRKMGRKLAIQFTDDQAHFGVFITHQMMLDLMSSINNTFAQVSDLDHVFSTSVNHIKNYLQCEATSLFLLDAERDEIECIASSGPVDINGMRLSVSEGIVGNVIQTGELAIVNDPVSDPRFASQVDATTGFKTKSIICAPLNIMGDTIGALEVLNKRGAGLFAGHDKVVVSALASATALAVVNQRKTAALIESEAQIIQASKLATLGELSASIAHELNQPLNVIRMAAGNCLLKLNTGEADIGYLSAKLERIENQTSRAAEIIDHMRNFGRVASEAPSMINPVSIAKNAIQLVEDEIRLGDIKLTAVFPNSCPEVVGNAIQLEQVVLNLLTNARDALSDFKKGAEIIVEVISSLSEVIISVADNGAGIDEDNVQLLFEPFFTTKVAGKGTGLGLSVSHNIITEMGGTLVAKNGNDGAIFTITLPVADSGH